MGHPLTVFSDKYFPKLKRIAEDDSIPAGASFWLGVHVAARYPEWAWAWIGDDSVRMGPMTVEQLQEIVDLVKASPAEEAHIPMEVVR